MIKTMMMFMVLMTVDGDGEKKTELNWTICCEPKQAVHHSIDNGYKASRKFAPFFIDINEYGYY